MTAPKIYVGHNQPSCFGLVDLSLKCRYCQTSLARIHHFHRLIQWHLTCTLVGTHHFVQQCCCLYHLKLPHRHSQTCVYLHCVVHASWARNHPACIPHAALQTKELAHSCHRHCRNHLQNCSCFLAKD